MTYRQKELLAQFTAAALTGVVASGQFVQTSPSCIALEAIRIAEAALSEFERRIAEKKED